MYGMWKEVKPRIGKVVTRLKRGASWAEAMQADDCLDTSTTPGLLAVDGPGVYGGPHFHCFGPLRVVRAAIHDERLPGAAEEALFVASLETAWGVTRLLGTNNGPWVWPAERYRPLLRAAVRFWDVLDAVGPRYTEGSSHGRSLWHHASNVEFALARLGVSNAEMDAALQSGRLAELAARHHLLDVQ